MKRTIDTQLTVGLWCNAAFGLHVCSMPYLRYVFAR